MQALAPTTCASLDMTWSLWRNGMGASTTACLSRPFMLRPRRITNAARDKCFLQFRSRGKTAPQRRPCERMTRIIMSLGCPLDVEFRGCRYRIEGRNNLIERGLLTRPSYNAEEIEFLGQAVADGGVAVDIGSNIGLYSSPLARVAGATGTVLSIDANPEMVEHLMFNAKASGLWNLVMLNLAVGGEEAMVDLRIRQNDVAIVGVE